MTLSSQNETINSTNVKYRNIFLLILIGVVVAIGFYGSNPEYYTTSQINLFLTINNKLSGFSAFWLNATALGDIMMVLPILSIFILKKVRIWAAVFGSIPLGVVLTHLNKRLFEIPRPAAVVDVNQFEVVGQILRGHTSFPSGHTITIFAATTVILCVLIREIKTQHQILWGIFLTLFATVVGVSRIAVGAHWPVDVLVGALLGTLSGISGVFLTYKYTAWWEWMIKEKSRYIHIIILLPLSYVVISRYHEIAISWVSLSISIFVIASLFVAIYKKKQVL